MIKNATPPPEVPSGLDYSRVWEYENCFYHTSSPSRIAKAIGHWEIYKKITHLPGAILECGVFKGTSIIRLATFREMLESDFSRKIIGFDIFGEFPDDVKSEDDKAFVEWFKRDSGCGIPKKDMEIILNKKGFENISLIEGNLLTTLPEYLDKNPQLRIAILHIDVDVYEPTKCCLSLLYDRVVEGGVIMFDDYAEVGGATIAVDEFFRERDIRPNLKKSPYYRVPIYIVKE